MKRSIFGAAALALTLAACSDGADISTADADTDGDGAVSMAEAGAAVDAAGGAIKPKAGQYKATVQMIDAKVPGVSAEQMNPAAMNTTVEYCVTQEQAENGFQDMMSQGQEGDCSYEKFDLDGDQLDAVLICKGGGGEMRMTMDGTVGATKTETNMTMTSQIPGVGEASMTMKNTAEWVSDTCTQ